MAVLQECPGCRKKQSTKNRLCKCGEDLAKAKRNERVKYWISYRMPDGKQRRESVGAMEGLNGFSIEHAKDALSKRKVQKRENRIFDMLPESNMTFKELCDWYLDLPSAKMLASHSKIRSYMNSFNKIHGDKIVSTIKPEDLEKHQALREGQGWKPGSIDQEIYYIKKAISKAFDNDKLDGQALKMFRGIKSRLVRGDNARTRTISFDEYLTLVDSATSHFKPVLIVAYHTGMRSGELQKLQWNHIDRKEMFIRLPKEITKKKMARDVPINHHVKTVLDNLPRSISHDFVFTNYKGKRKGEPLAQKNGFAHLLRNACKKAGIPYGDGVEGATTFRDLRRTLKTNMLNAGIDQVYRDLIVGHKLKGMDIHYLAVKEDVLKDRMEQFTQWLDGQLNSANVDQSVDQSRVTG